MSILILVEKRLPSSEGLAPINVPHHAPLNEAVKNLSKVYKIQKDDFEFEYAIDTILQEKDEDSITKKAFNEAYDSARVQALINKHQVIILMGANLCEKVLDKKLTKVRGTAQVVDGRVFLPTYSPLTLHKDKVSCTEVFSEAYKRHIGDYIYRDTCGYEIVDSIDRLKEVAEYRHITKIFSFDYETSTLDYFREDAYATILSITFQPGFSFIIPIKHYERPWSSEDFEQVLTILRQMFSDPEVHKVAHNLKFDFHFNTVYGIELRGRLSCTQLMSHTLDENRRHGLKELTKIYFPFWSGYGDDVDFLGPIEPLSQYAAMDTDITLMLYYIFEAELLLTGNERLYRLSRNMTIPVLKALQKIEYRGCHIDREAIIKTIDIAKGYLQLKIDKLNSFPEVQRYIQLTNEVKKNDKLQELEVKLASRLTKLKSTANKKIKQHEDAIELILLEDDPKSETKIEKRSKKIEELKDSLDGKYDRYIPSWIEEIRKIKTNQVIYFKEVNYNSNTQVPDILYDIFRFPLPKERGKVVRSSKREYIQDFDSEFVHVLSAYRTIAKMISTYYEGILTRLDVNDKVHGSFLQHGTKTRRLAGRDPNLQNIPARLGYEDEHAEWCLKQVKKFFIPPSEDYYLIQADFSQAELRVIANESGDPTMRQAYIDGEDLHAKTGAMIRGVTLEEFYTLPKKEYKKYRTHAKPANFGWVYKASIEGYMEFAKNQYGVILTEEEAKRHRDAIFNTYSTLSKWHTLCEAKAKRDGYMENMFGGRRRFLNINQTNHHFKSLVNQDIRNCINNPIQGSAGEYTNFCIALLNERLPDDCPLWCTVHDSIFFYVPKNKLHYLEIINDTCENLPLRDYFLIDDSKYPVKMEMEYEISDKSWGEFEEIGKFDKVKEIL